MATIAQAIRLALHYGETHLGVTDVFGEDGSAHIESLCKWDSTSFTHRARILPSGRPPEERVTLNQPDPTWDLEYAHFKRLVEGGATTDLSTDLWLHRTLSRLGADAIAAVEDPRA